MTDQGPGMVRRDEGEAIWYLGNLYTFKQTGRAAVVEQVTRKGFTIPRHIHSKEDETQYILDGRISFFCGDQTFEATAGDLVFLPAGFEHTFRVESDTATHLLYVNPGGLESFFRDLGEPAAERRLPDPPGPIDRQKFAAAMARYDVEIVGPAPV